MRSMESDKEVSNTNSSVDGVKLVMSHDEMIVDALAPQVCQKSNGTVEMAKSESFTPAEMASLAEVISNKSSVANAVSEALTEGAQNAAPPGSDDKEASPLQNSDQLINSEPNNLGEASKDVSKNLVDASDIPEKTILGSDKDAQQTEVEMNVAFETEVVVEENGSSQDVLRLSAEQDDTKNLLNDLDQNIEFNEVLCSSDISGNIENNIENNNCAKQEVFNKEELLDILEGNDEEPPSMSENSLLIPQNEVQIALQQLSRLREPKQRQPRRKLQSAEPTDKKENQRKVVKVRVKVDKGEKATIAKISKLKNLTIKKRITKKTKTTITPSEPKTEVVTPDNKEVIKNDSIVHKLVEDWDEEETDQIKVIPADTSENVIPTEVAPTSVANTQETITEEDENITADLMTGSENQNANKSGDESQPQRRLGRVIKKKIIFDPDNPDTFTKGKSSTPGKEPQQDPPVKKGKIDVPVRPKSKSPVAKLQWKKPTPKGNKQNKRLTEVDKLLMDEGAVNMIYQLTPEATKGKKNVRTKAELIKKMQSSTPDSNEMKFRERKKELKEEEAKKILGGKQRASLSSSVKSMSVCEDFETHSADDSIIYRRHSSSSYSSSCMSPRRMSDIEGNISASQGAPKSVSKSSQETIPVKPVSEKNSEVFMAGTPIKVESSPNIIDKSCLSIKQKLNSKLSQALNKRKREISKTEKPTKIQKVKESPNKNKPFDYVGFKYLNVKIDHRLAEITITHTGKKSVAVLKEIEAALLYVSNKSDVSVTLLTSTCGSLCSSLNLQPLLDDNIETRTNAAHELAEAVRLVLLSARQHSKLLVSCVWAASAGLALGLLALSDVAVAGEAAELALAGPVPQPGAAAVASKAPQLVSDLVLFDRRLSAREAAAGGLVTHALPDAAQAARRLAVGLAAVRPPSIQLKKKLLNLSSGASEAAFLSSLEAERDLFVEYWTSVDGQELIRSQNNK